MDDDQIREFSEKMSERIASLEDRNDKLLETARRVEGEKRYAETELVRLQKEVRRLKQELDRLKSPPLIIGNIRDILADSRVVVKSSTGPDFIVNAAEYITKENLVVGARVALNKQTLAVMGVLPPSLDPIVTGAEIIEKPPVSSPSARSASRSRRRGTGKSSGPSCNSSPNSTASIRSARSRSSERPTDRTSWTRRSCGRADSTGSSRSRCQASNPG